MIICSLYISDYKNAFLFDESLFLVVNVLSFWYRSFEKVKISKMAKKSTFYSQNLNSDTTFISSTLKVEETKVVSEF